MRASVVAFVLISMVPHIEARETHERSSEFSVICQEGLFQHDPPTAVISTAERTGASNRSPAHTQGPIAQAASAQKMFLTRSATDLLQGLPACRQHYPHSAKISAPSFNPASMRSGSRLQSGPRRVTRPHRILQISESGRF
jgi:hypothetical protein